MKIYVLSLVLYLLVINSSAKIKNGYTDIEGALTSLKCIQTILWEDKSLSALQKASMRTKRNDLINYIVYHSFTENQLEQFKRISPDLYNDLDRLKDRNGRNPDVFVKFVLEEKMPPSVVGASNVSQDEKDKHAYVSEYGKGTVSIVIAAVNNCLQLLAHELGHVKYQVLNVAQYAVFYAKNYPASISRGTIIGHNDHDASGKSAGAYTRRFRENYLTFLKQGNKKPNSYISLLQGIKNEVMASAKRKGKLIKSSNIEGLHIANSPKLPNKNVNYKTERHQRDVDL